MQKLIWALALTVSFLSYSQEPRLTKKSPPMFKVLPGGNADVDGSLDFVTNRSVTVFSGETEETANFFRDSPTSKLKYGRYSYRFLGTKHVEGKFDTTVEGKGIKRVTEKEALADPKRSRYEPEVLVIIHGYNTDFDTSVKQAVLFQHDLYSGHHEKMKYLDTKVYTWASAGNPALYTFERSDIKFNAPPLAGYIQKIVRERGPEKVNFILHSMGNDVFLTAIEQLDKEGLLKDLKFGRVILAAADVSQEHFTEAVPKLVAQSRKVVQYVSSEDKALRYSKKVNIADAGLNRAGAKVISNKGVEVVDCAEVTDPKDRHAHSYYASAPYVLDDIAALFEDETYKQTPEERYPDRFERKTLDDGFEYWAFKPVKASRK